MAPLTVLFGQSNAEKPKLVVGIVVDQMRYDYLQKFSEKFTTGGFNRIISNGFSCENNYLNYVPTHTAPGHAGIYTGALPAQHGILSNFWYDRTIKEAVYCVSDPSVEPVGTGNKTGRNSPQRLLVETIGDVNRAQTQMKGKTISISIKNRAAILSGGHKANAAYWFRGQDQGHWITSSYYMDALPEWVKKFNDTDQLTTYMNTWELLYPFERYSESGPDERPFERGFRGKQTPTFPYNLTELATTNGGFDILKATPFGNTYTLDFAAAALKGEKLGKDNATDFLLISLSSSDYIGHNFGVNSKEIQDTYLRLDQDLEKFLNKLDLQMGEGNYVLFLTSDHGATENPKYLLENGGVGGYFKEATFIIQLKDYLYKLYGSTEIIEHVALNQVYLNKELLVTLNLNASEVEKLIQEYILLQPQIQTAVTRTQLLNHEFTDGLELLIQNGFHPDRSGDIAYLLEPSVVVYSETGSDHGSGYEHDTHVPLLFYGLGIKPGRTHRLTSSADIVSTIAALLAIEPPKTASGHVIGEMIE
jgi:predicted AlkP superfamily pyrophosphatase or phosphodiesterase